MPVESPRIAELRRRVDADPSSIAFAQLAEEYRRGGNYEAAEQCCRTGLTRHPSYLSARVTLGRTLIELDKLDEAEQELNSVLKSAPDNLAAIRGMAEIHQRRGNLEAALDFYRRALPLARHDPEIEETVKKINRDLGTSSPKEKPGLSFKEAQDEFLKALNQLPAMPAAPKKLDLPLRDVPPVVAPLPEPPIAPIDIHIPTPPPKPADVDTKIDFDSLLKSLGAVDQLAPPMVEALLSEPAAPAARPEPVLPELPVHAEKEDPFADLERGLRAFDHPPSPAPSPEPLGYGEVSFDTAPAYHEAAAAPVVPYGEVAFEAPPVAPAPAASVAPEHRTAPRAPDAPSAPETGEPSAEEQSVLDELEAWLAAIKR